MFVAFLLSVTTQKAHTFSNRRIIRRYHTTLTGRHILGRVERKAARTKATNRLPIYVRSMCLAGVLNDRDIVSLRQWD